MIINKIADLVMYSGPEIDTLINEASRYGKLSFIQEMGNGRRLLIIEEIVSYKTSVIDKYLYDSNNKLINHSIIINGKESIVFDKQSEILEILNTQLVIKTA